MGMAKYMEDNYEIQIDRLYMSSQSYLKETKEPAYMLQQRSEKSTRPSTSTSYRREPRRKVSGGYQIIHIY